ncbi:flagellar M-ring protein FliF [Seohaeicola saemankumensis]|uniref:flagellar basal-body MS-ring/collar protein FliF n=1 Tax=Seohaeicola saemankumensis TaxID=481181 RepID=UPI001E2C82BF|nr:flagellar basal-body MS-ring/collar protein FliF [Seohaeicola saemankumensis]MCD1625027.1 flagellar M-ring protein FliF [Seohaeicola saemankumensis]
MPQILNVWSALDLRKRIVVGIVSLIMFLAILGLGKLASAPSMSLLYAGLDARAAGEVLQALEQRSVVHDVRGAAIYVDALQRDSLRMSLAGEGLPAINAQGYELLDSLTGFGTTAQMFDATYWRAKEGELGRTIITSPAIQSARVHIARAGSTPFLRETKPSASVTVTTLNGALTQEQAQAIRYLVSAAVASLKPDDVAIIDSVSGLITPLDPNGSTLRGDERINLIRERVTRLLEARVGLGNAMVEVNITAETDTETIRERSFDPNSRVAISTDTEEENNSSTNMAGGTVTVASNLPDGDAQAGSGARSSNNQSRERVNYEVSETSRELMKLPGAIKRMTVAVLVNGVAFAEPGGEARFEPRSDEELETLRDLVASAVGFDESRGDVITLKSMEFLQNEPLGTESSSTLLGGLQLDAISLIQFTVLTVVILILGLFVLRPILRGNGLRDEMTAPSFATTKEVENSDSLTPLTGEIADDDFNPIGLQMAPTPAKFESKDVSVVGDSVERLRFLIAERQDETVEILRGWLEDRRGQV